jgi:hypothetical protein
MNCFPFREIHDRVADDQSSAPKSGSRSIGRPQEVGERRMARENGEMKKWIYVIENK